MVVLTDRQIKLAEQLLITILKKEPNVTYSELAERITPKMHHRQVGKDIGEISKLCYQLGLPLLSAKVINKNSHTVGEGFFGLCEELGIDAGTFSERDLCKREMARIRECDQWYILSDYLGLNLDFKKPFSEIFPNEVTPDKNMILHEGSVKQVLVNQYERNSAARNSCIEKYGYSCFVCGITFKDIYGDIGENFIHIHHIVPLHEINHDYIVDGEKDLIPVCPNCHAMLHKEINGKYLTPEELKSRIKNYD